MKTVKDKDFVLGINKLRETLHGSWFVNFGSLLGLIRHKDCLPNEHDMDISMFYDFVDGFKVEQEMHNAGYYTDHMIIDDMFRKPIYICFSHDALPWVDISFLYPFDKFYYHTHDYTHERKEVPSQYMLWGFPQDIISPKLVVERKLDVGSYKGVKVPVPSKYGSVLDISYPFFMEDRAGTSHSPWTLQFKSFIELTPEFAARQHKASKNYFDGWLRTI